MSHSDDLDPGATPDPDAQSGSEDHVAPASEHEGEGTEGEAPFTNTALTSEAGGEVDFGVALSPAESLQYMREDYPAETAALVREWGTGKNFNDNLSFARAAARAFATPAIMAALEDSGVGNSPDLMRALAGIGRRMAEVPGDPDTVTREGPIMTPRNQAAVQDRIDEIMQMVGTPAYTSKKIQRELNALYDSMPGASTLIDGWEQREI